MRLPFRRKLYLGPAPATLALIVVLLSPSVAHAAQGLQGGQAVSDSGQVGFAHSLSSELGMMQEAGAGWVRINFRLGGCFPNWTTVGCNGRTALQTYDDVVNAARSNNLQVLGLISNESWKSSQSKWTASNAENTSGSGDNSYIRAFANNAVKPLATHFTARIRNWEIWNEPNAWHFNPRPGVYEGGSFIYPSNFAWLLKRSYSALKNVDSGNSVISGGCLDTT